MVRDRRGTKTAQQRETIHPEKSHKTQLIQIFQTARQIDLVGQLFSIHLEN